MRLTLCAEPGPVPADEDFLWTGEPSRFLGSPPRMEKAGVGSGAGSLQTERERGVVKAAYKSGRNTSHGGNIRRRSDLLSHASLIAAAAGDEGKKPSSHDRAEEGRTGRNARSLKKQLPNSSVLSPLANLQGGKTAMKHFLCPTFLLVLH